MATYTTYSKSSSTSTASSTLISSTSKAYMNKTSLNHHLHHQFITPTASSTRYIKNTMPISYQHNSLKTTSTISRCKPSSRYYTSTCTPLSSDSSRLERNYSYIEAMKETKSLPSSSNSSSTSTIESPISENPMIQPQIDEVEIPIEIKLIENNSNLAKSRSQSSIFNLFRTTFSPFQIRKWRSKSRDKLLYNSSVNQNVTQKTDTLFKEPQLKPKQNYTQMYQKKTCPHKDYTSRHHQDFVLPMRSQTVDTEDRKENNFSYTSSMSSNSNSSDSSNLSFSKISPKISSPTTNSRQLSYLKLTCLLNGYDNNEIKDDKLDSGSVKSIYLKSSKALLNNTERYYDVRPNFKKYTSSTIKEIKLNHDDLDGQVYKTELSVRLNLNDNTESTKTNDVDLSLINKIEPINDVDVKNDLNCNNFKNDENEKVTDGVDNTQVVVEQVEELKIDELKNIEDRQAVYDGYYYIDLLDKTTEHINKLCKDYQIYTDESSDQYVQNEESQGHIKTTIGKGQLLINQKFKQFRGLCDKNIRDKTDPVPLKEGEFVTRDDDLAGFWDMVYLQVQDIDGMFEKLSELKKNKWIAEVKPVVKATAPKKKPQAKSTETAASKARAEAARQRIQEMKKKAALAKSQNQSQEPELIFTN